MSIQTLVEKIKEKGNPTVAGLDARLEYIPQHISGRNMCCTAKRCVLPLRAS